MFDGCPNGDNNSLPKLLQPSELATILENNASCALEIKCGQWCAELSAILATQDYEMHLALTSTSSNGDFFRFSDGGTAFVEAMEERSN